MSTPRRCPECGSTVHIVDRFTNATDRVQVRRRCYECGYTTSNSYDRHCGERAIECAEGDLLGELLEACEAAERELLTWLVIDGPLTMPDYLDHPVIRRLKAAIAAATND